MTASEPREDFTHKGYTEILGRFKSQGYQTVPYHSLDPTKTHLLLRHDIDICLDRALALAEIEKDLDLHATYFLLLRSEFYNPWAPAALKKIRRLVELGHYLGVHFDIACYPDFKTDTDLVNKITEECDRLELEADSPVKVVSFHRPAPHLLGKALDLGKRLHTYAPRFFSETTYLSDSLERWPGGHPLEHPAFRDKKPIQLLIHPIWWSAETDTSLNKLRSFLRERQRFLDQELERNLQPYRMDPPSWDHSRIQRATHKEPLA